MGWNDFGEQYIQSALTFGSETWENSSDLKKAKEFTGRNGEKNDGYITCRERKQTLRIRKRKKLKVF